jgi:hypothetical protein
MLAAVIRGEVDEIRSCIKDGGSIARAEGIWGTTPLVRCLWNGLRICFACFEALLAETKQESVSPSKQVQKHKCFSPWNRTLVPGARRVAFNLFKRIG